MISVRYDGSFQDSDYPGDGLCFTFLSHFIGTDGRDFIGTSWVGLASLVRNTGVNLDNVQIISKGDK